ncbi:MAG: hypothetical protein J0M02_19535, partial [Planctomycetes bacterium]|nr:hypothetical protein [Planctomycetota bacterium]
MRPWHPRRHAAWWQGLHAPTLCAIQAGSTLLFLVLLWLWGAAPEARGSYISEMRDAGPAGLVLMLLLAVAAALSLALALRLRLSATAVGLRVGLAAGILLLFCTASNDAVHVAAFAATVALGAANLLHSSWSLFCDGCGEALLPLLLVAGAALAGDGHIGPPWQKSLVAALVTVESAVLAVRTTWSPLRPHPAPGWPVGQRAATAMVDR